MPQLFAKQYHDWSGTMSKPREPCLTQVRVEKKTPNPTKVTLEETKNAPSLTAVAVEGRNGRKNRKMSSARESEFVYVNSAFVGSVSSVNGGGGASGSRRTDRATAAPAAPITEVYREQYWACSRWPYTQRVLAIAVGVLFGALIGLTLSLLLRDADDNTVIGPIFTR